MERTRDGLYVQLRDLEEQRRGISPKLGLHATLTAQINSLREQLGGQGVEGIVGRRMGLGAMTSLNGAPIKVFKPQATCSHKRREGCIIAGCPNMPKANGRCGSCGRTRYGNRCHKHKGSGVEVVL